jgi:proteasome accessory factor A
MRRRIFGLETEYGITCSFKGQRRLSPDEVARYLFRSVVSRGGSSNMFLGNGGRLYLDVGSHPEYATAECDSMLQLIAQDEAGKIIVQELADLAELRLREEGVEGDIYLFRNNTDSVGNSYGCHENYLVDRMGDFVALTEQFIPFLVSRQLVTGAGKVLPQPEGATFCLSQRADHMWEGLASSTTRSRPIINTRDEPHADADRYRRLHVIVGDSNMSQVTTRLKVGMGHLMLSALEGGVSTAHLALENPIKAIREISHDITGRTPVALADGRRMSALELQGEYLATVTTWLSQSDESDDPEHAWTVELWSRALSAIESGDLASVETELDWVIKLRLLNRYLGSQGLDWDSPRIAQLDLAFHDIKPDRGIFPVLVRRGLAADLIAAEAITEAVTVPPQTTRARLRGDFVRHAAEAGRDYAVDWGQLKLNDLPPQVVFCSDPFVSVDERVESLINAL